MDSRINSPDFSSLAKTLNSNLPLKLDKTNYIYWKTQVMPAIRALDLEDYISPSVSAPPKLIEVLSHDEQGSSTIKHQINPAFAVWKKADQILLCWLLGTLSPSVLGQVTRYITSLEMWTKLERVYSQQSIARILQLRQQLQSIKKGSDSISDFVLKLKNIGDVLLEAGEDVSERDLLLALMNGVGHEYDSVVVLISSQQHTMPLDDARFLFLMHEQRIESLNVHAPTAHFASNNNSYNNRSNANREGNSGNYRGNRPRGRGGRFPSRGGGKIHCQLCSKPGHGALQCYRHFDQQFQGLPSVPNQQGNQSALVSQQTQNIAYDAGQISYGSQAISQPSVNNQQTAYYASPESVNDQAWYVDSGATNHVTADLNNLSLKQQYRGQENRENSFARSF
ncbi:hypothetical protein ACOSQ4_004455 [Xanthoceras sorbifolium]